MEGTFLHYIDTFFLNQHNSKTQWIKPHLNQAKCTWLLFCEFVIRYKGLAQQAFTQMTVNSSKVNVQTEVFKMQRTRVCFLVCQLGIAG